MGHNVPPLSLNRNAGGKVKSLLKAIDAISGWAGKIISFLIVPTVLILVYETVMRYGFNAPTPWVHHISWNLTGPFFLLGGAYGLLHRGHVNMDVIYNRFPLRWRAIIDLFTAILFFLFVGVLLWKGMGYAWDSVLGLENSGCPLYFPIYPIKLFLPIAAFLLLLQGSAKFIRDLVTAISGEKYEH